MAELIKQDPQSAADYDDRTTAAVRSVLLEIGQILGSFRGKFAVIGGAVPWLLLNNEEMPHVGTLDVDLGLDAESLGDGEYASLIEALMKHGYGKRDDLKRFQLLRKIDPRDGGGPVDVIVDFLMPRNVEVTKHDPPLIENFAVQRADGADLATQFSELVAIEGAMPAGGTNRIEIAVCTIPALLAMKGYALQGRHKQKDAYDIYYCVRNYEGGTEALANDCRPLLNHPSALAGYRHIDAKFAAGNGYGPTSVRHFVEETAALGDRTPEQWEQDAFGQVDEWLKFLGIRK
jgi:hypothetical protein